MIALLSLFHISMLGIVMASAQIDALVQRCAINVGPVTMKAIISVESGGNPYSIDDDTARKSYEPQTLVDAVATASHLLDIGHNFDAGIAQVNSQNFTNEGLTLDNMFDACTNVRAGGDILGRSYAAAARLLWIGHVPRTIGEQHLQEQLALRHAFSIYNSGSAYNSMHYSDLVVNAASREIAYQPVAAEPLYMTALAVKPKLFIQPTRVRTHRLISHTGISVVRHLTLAQLAAIANDSSLEPKFMVTK